MADPIPLKKRLQRLLLRWALGETTCEAMQKSFSTDPRAPTAFLVDIVVRKDSIERRTQADWVKDLARILT